MKVLRGLFIGFSVLLLLFVAGLFATGNGSMLTMGWALLLGGPELPFDPADAVQPPDYDLEENWAALPSRAGVEDRIPTGISDTDIQGRAPVDVFFIHPTGYLTGNSWTFSMDANTSTEENTQWMMANQASSYNGCCNIYAPRYRQANIFAYFKGEQIRDEVLAFAYQDVVRAFDYFLAKYSQGRPFIIASHSQGTHHGARLLRDKIDGTALAERLVAAYIIGGGIAASDFDGLRDISLCEDARDLRCAVHWDTYSEAVIDQPLPDNIGNICVNPLSWRVNGGLASKQDHKGAVPVSGEFQVALFGDDDPNGVVFEPLAAPIPNMLQAQCKDGVLYISDQSDSEFGSTGGSFGGGNYHGLDYPVFHMDIRENAKHRVATYLAERVAGP